MDNHTRMNTTEKNGKKIKEGFIGQKMIVLPPNIKRQVLKNELTKRLFLTAIGHYPRAAFHNRERKTGCSQYILLYCTGGTGTIIINGRSFQLLPNHFIILPRNVAHKYSASPEDPWTLYWIHFMGEIADMLFDRYSESASEPVFIAYEDRKIKEFELIFNLLESNFEMRNLEILNMKLQDCLSSFIYAGELNSSDHEDDKISASMLFMKENISRQYSVQELAEQQHLSATHYSRLFRLKTGSSPNQYFSELKIQASCQYLYFTDLSIKEICTELGFSDPYYFSRLFKKLMGISPAKYKRRRN